MTLLKNAVGRRPGRPYTGDGYRSFDDAFCAPFPPLEGHDGDADAIDLRPGDAFLRHAPGGDGAVHGHGTLIAGFRAAERRPASASEGRGEPETIAHRPNSAGRVALGRELAALETRSAGAAEVQNLAEDVSRIRTHLVAGETSGKLSRSLRRRLHDHLAARRRALQFARIAAAEGADQEPSPSEAS